MIGRESWVSHFAGLGMRESGASKLNGHRFSQFSHGFMYYWCRVMGFGFLVMMSSIESQKSERYGSRITQLCADVLMW